MARINMAEASPREMAERIRVMETAMIVISTWARCDNTSGQTRIEAMAEIRTKRKLSCAILFLSSSQRTPSKSMSATADPTQGLAKC